MPLYKCIVSNNKGKKTTVLREAFDENTLLLSFNLSDNFLLSFSVISKNDVAVSKRHFNSVAISVFTDIMSALLGAGINLKDSIELCALIANNAKVKQLCNDILTGLKKGNSLYSAVCVYSSSFSPLYRALIHLGEEIGSVSKVFEMMSAYLHTDRKIKDKILNALLYPAIVLVIAVAGCAGIVFYILPKMENVFSVFNSSADNRINIEIGNIYNSLYFFLVIFFLFVFIVVLSICFYKKNEKFANFFDMLVLKAPVVGNFISFLQTLNFAFAMEMLTAGGFTVSKALKESVIVITNNAFKKSLIDINNKLLHGNSLSDAFLNSKIIPDYVGTWISVGEKTGRVKEVFSQIRIYFQEIINNSTQRLMNLIEPLFIVLAGVIIFILVIQFVLPIFSFYGKIL
jgi:type II secretory pathway component PulF